VAFGWLLLCFGSACFAQDHVALCPRHIETPTYPAIGRTAHVTGKITLTVTIGADGNVEHVDAVTDDPVQQKHPILQKYAIKNMQHWTFAKPPYAPYTEVVIYDYELDPALPEGTNGKTTFDLPNHVSISTSVATIEVEESRTHN
jgi:hypothetical protein